LTSAGVSQQVAPFDLPAGEHCLFYFLHITKCAGTSFIALARKNASLFRPSANGNPLNPLTAQRLRYWIWTPAEQRYFLSSGLCELVANENQLGPDFEFYEGVRYITILRDPLDRLFSEYQFRMRPDKTKSLEERGQLFAGFLQRDRGVRWRRNTLLTALTYRGGSPTERLQLAKQRLLQFDHLFLMDQMAGQFGALAAYGWQHVELPWRNTPASRDDAACWSEARAALQEHPQLLEELLEVHEQDLELYAFASALAAGQKSALRQQQRIPLAADRSMPDSEDFEFVLFCAYEAFLKDNTPRCLELLQRAGDMPEAEEIDLQDSEGFVDFAMERFGVPRRAEKERRTQRRRRAPTTIESRS
jgi:hypothetical protein